MARGFSKNSTSADCQSKIFCASRRSRRLRISLVSSSLPVVAIARANADNLKEDILHVLRLSGCMDAIDAARRILIKPNLVTDKADYIALGANTSVEVLDALLAIFAARGKDVAVAESETGTAVKGRKLNLAWERMGLPALASRHGAQLLNLTESPRRWVPFHGSGLKGLELPVPALDADLILNIPKIKTHKYATLTCAMKNLFGLVPEPRRIIYHHWLAETIHDLAMLFNPKMITLVDGLIGMEGNGPLYGTPVELNLLLAGRDCFAIDATVCRIIGIDPMSVPYLAIAAEHFNLNCSQQTAGETVESTQRPFRPVEFNLYRTFEKKLMESPLVHIITAEWFQRHFSRHLASITQRLRGGGYSWYLDRDSK